MPKPCKAGQKENNHQQNDPELCGRNYKKVKHPKSKATGTSYVPGINLNWNFCAIDLKNLFDFQYRQPIK